jgi:hypothetical protein
MLCPFHVPVLILHPAAYTETLPKLLSACFGRVKWLVFHPLLPSAACTLPAFNETLSTGTCASQGSLADGGSCTLTCTPGVSYSTGTSGSLTYGCASGVLVPPSGVCVACPSCSSAVQYQQSPCGGMLKPRRRAAILAVSFCSTA